MPEFKILGHRDIYPTSAKILHVVQSEITEDMVVIQYAFKPDGGRTCILRMHESNITLLIQALIEYKNAKNSTT